MKRPTKSADSGKPLGSGGLPSLRIVSGEELGHLEASIQRAIAYRAYDLFQERGGNHGHDLEDWFRAENELAHPADVEISEVSGQLRVRATVSGFSADEIQIGVAPRKLIVWGQAAREGPSAKSGAVQMLGEIELPVTVDSEKASATLTDGILNFQASEKNTGTP